MATFLYRGYTADGRRRNGAAGVKTEGQMADYLKKRKIENFDIFPSETQWRRGVYKLVTQKELSMFCKQMSVLFHSHMTLMEGIMVLIEQTENTDLKQALKEIYSFMDRGFSFSESIGMFDHIFSSYLLNMVVIGETSGTLDSVFSQMSEYYDKEHKIRKKIKTAITYPAILTVLMAAIIVLLIVQILPMFADILESMGSSIPSGTAVILSAGSFLASYGWIIIAVVVVIVIICILWARSEKGIYRFDKMKFGIPAYRYITRRVITSRLARSLAILFKSGVQILNALEEVTVLMDNTYLEEKLMEAVEKSRNKEGISTALKEVGMFPALFLKMFDIGERTGHLDEMLDKAAKVFDDEVDDAVERFTALLEPVLIIILSIIVGIILLSVVLPMIAVMSSI